MDVVTLHRGTVTEFVTRVEATHARQMGDPTPCTEWKVRELVNHLVGEDRWTPPILQGRTIEEIGGRFEGDLLGDDPAAVAREAGEEACAAVADAVPAGGLVHLSFGDAPVEEYVWQLAADHLVHAWDLAAATGGDTRLKPELVDAVAGWFADQEDMYRLSGAIGPPAAADSADAQSRLIAAFGRDPRWSRPAPS